MNQAALAGSSEKVQRQRQPELSLASLSFCLRDSGQKPLHLRHSCKMSFSRVSSAAGLRRDSAGPRLFRWVAVEFVR